MGQKAHLSTWLAVDTKQRFAQAAFRQGVSESALLKRLVEQMLSAGSGEPAAVPPPAESRGTRLTVRLVPEDRALLRERAAARTMPASTYVSNLVRSHLRGMAPLPDRELAALQAAVTRLDAVGRNVNIVVRLLEQNAQQPLSLRQEAYVLIRVCEGTRDHFRDVIRTNHRSWEFGHVETDR